MGLASLKKVKCPRCSYETAQGKELLIHLVNRHEKEAYNILLELLIRGEIKIEVT